jgi:hypothetical protein
MKTNKRFLRSAMLIAVLAALGASRAALADNEVEPNDPLSMAQALVVGSDGTVTVYGEIFNTSGPPAHRDVDFYSFQAQAGDVVTMNIDGGMKLTGTSIDTVLAIFGPVTPTNNTNLLPLQQVDDANLDPGSIDTADARIDNFHIPTTGTYVVGVTTYPGYFTNSDQLSDGSLVATSPLMDVPGGTYTLIISGVTPPAPPPVVVTPPPPPPVQQINIEIRPGSRDVMFAYSKGHHVFGRDSDSDRDQHFEAIRGRFNREGGMPVALLSSADFNAMDVDQTSLKFGATGDEDSLVRCNKHGLDVNGDKLPDLICHFDFRKANFKVGDNQGIVTGATKSGQDFEGKGWLKIISGKRHHHDDHDGSGDSDHGHHGRR